MKIPFLRSRVYTALGCALIGLAWSEPSRAADVRIPGRKIWDISRITDRTQSRMELTDLIRFKGYWYCGFHEGEIHNNHPTGRGRIIRSVDGEKWESVALFSWDGGDVREPRLSITSEGILMVNTSVCFVEKAAKANGSFQTLRPGSYPPSDPPLSDKSDLEPAVGRQSVTWFSSDGVNWTSAYACPSGVNNWRWDVTWHNGMGYSVGYAGKDAGGMLYRTRDGKAWRPLRDKFFRNGHGNEATIAFGPDNTAYCLLRGTVDSHILGVGKPPYYQDWEWKQTQIDRNNDGKLQPVHEVMRSPGGPKMIRLKDGRFLAAARSSGVALFWVDPEKAVLTRFATVDGTSYAGIAEHEGEIWVTYADSAAAGIYLAKLKLPPVTAQRG